MDAICPWCYAFAKTMTNIQQQYGEKYVIKVLPGGLAIGKMVAPVRAMKDHLIEGNDYVEKTTGVKMGANFKKNIAQNDDYMLNSEKSCLAINAVGILMPDQNLNFALDVENAFYQDGMDLNSDETFKILIKNICVKYFLNSSNLVE